MYKVFFLFLINIEQKITSYYCLRERSNSVREELDGAPKDQLVVHLQGENITVTQTSFGSLQVCASEGY